MSEAEVQPHRIIERREQIDGKVACDVADPVHGDLVALEDTLDLLSDPAARAEIEAGREDVATGRVITADELRAKYLHR